MLYTSLVLHLFDYGYLLWGDKNNMVLVNSIRVLEDKAAKLELILDKHPRYSSTEALQQLKRSTLAERRHSHRCIFIFKCIHGLMTLILTYEVFTT